MANRTNLTKVFLKQWNVCLDETNILFYSKIWWMDNRSNSTSLRLTKEGLDFLTNTLNLKSYKIPFTEPIDKSPQTVLYLTRFIDSPFYLTDFNITVFSEIRSLELYLFADDIRRYGLIKSLNARQKMIDK